MTYRACCIIVVLFTSLTAGVREARAAEWLCDSSKQNCRTPLLNLIRNERQRIDVSFWFMEDSRYSTALIEARKRGVRVRVLVDTKANTSYPHNATIIGLLKDGGIPIRRITSSWLHWKFMLFAGQNVVQFGSANYSPHAFVPTQSLVDFIDETIFFSDDPSIVNSFKTRFDDAWVSTSRFANYANVSGSLARAYPVYPMNSGLNFPPFQDFGARSAARYNAETAGIDVVMFRFGDRRHADAIIAAHRRGVPVRIYVEQGQYRDPKRPLSAYDVDRLHVAGIRIRQRNHRGWLHEKLTLLRGQRMAIFGTQNWTHTSGQYETNYFTAKQWIYQWLSDRFLRHWNSSTESKPFAPLPPTAPQYRSPSSGAQLTSSSQVTLRWHAGSWGYKYDVYIGTSSTPPLKAKNVVLGYSKTSTDYKSYTVTGLSPNRTYYWRIVSKTFANMAKSGPVRSFRTGA
jgi:hypothetical protein